MAYVRVQLSVRAAAYYYSCIRLWARCLLQKTMLTAALRVHISRWRAPSLLLQVTNLSNGKPAPAHIASCTASLSLANVHVQCMYRKLYVNEGGTVNGMRKRKTERQNDEWKTYERKTETDKNGKRNGG